MSITLRSWLKEFFGHKILYYILALLLVFWVMLFTQVRCSQGYRTFRETTVGSVVNGVGVVKSARMAVWGDIQISGGNTIKFSAVLKGEGGNRKVEVEMKKNLNGKWEIKSIR